VPQTARPLELAAAAAADDDDKEWR